MEYKKLIIQDNGAVRVIKINNPEALNALNTAILKELDAAFTEVAEDNGILAVVLTGHELCACFAALDADRVF